MSIVRFEDGSTVTRTEGQLSSSTGMAQYVLEEARRIVERTADAAVWYRTGSPQQRAVLREVYLDHLDGELFWLFRRDPLACVASTADRQFLAQLEVRLATFDRAVETRSLDDYAEAARRRTLLAEMGELGLLAEPLWSEKLAEIQELATLSSWTGAAQKLATYYASRERERYVRKPLPASLAVAPLSIDWARHVSAAPGFEMHNWWASCEGAFLGVPKPAGTRGTMWLSQGGVRARLAWREEDEGRAALYHAEVQVRSK